MASKEGKDEEEEVQGQVETFKQRGLSNFGAKVPKGCSQKGIRECQQRRRKGIMNSGLLFFLS
jgi:hypothetical protein